LQPGLF